MFHVQSNPIQSNPIQSNPIQSNPIKSNHIKSKSNYSQFHLASWHPCTVWLQRMVGVALLTMVKLFFVFYFGPDQDELGSLLTV